MTASLAPWALLPKSALMMRRSTPFHAACLAFAMYAFTATTAAATPKTNDAMGVTNGQHDFDWEIGTWKTHLKRRLRPLSGSQDWVEYDGTTTVSKVWNGRANLVELNVTGPAGRIEALSLRLYNPDARQWSLNFSSIAGGTMAIPTIGEFKDGRGEFYAQETHGGRSILVRFVISEFNRESAHYEQSFSDDGGKTWEVNWIAVDTRLK